VLRDIARARIRSPALPPLGAVRPRDVEFAAGEAQLRLEFVGTRDAWVFD
jgi:hypothetical protein